MNIKEIHCTISYRYQNIVIKEFKTREHWFPLNSLLLSNHYHKQPPRSFFKMFETHNLSNRDEVFFTLRKTKDFKETTAPQICMGIFHFIQPTIIYKKIESNSSFHLK